MPPKKPLSAPNPGTLFFLFLLAFSSSPMLVSAVEWWDSSSFRSLEQHLVRLSPQKQQPFVFQAGPLTSAKSSGPELVVDMELGMLGQTGQNFSQFHEIMPWRPLQPGEASRNTALRWALETGFQLDLPGGFFCHQRTIIDSDPFLDPTSRTKEYRQIDASVEIPLALVGYRKDQFMGYIGRRKERWGPGMTGSLVLDAHAPAGDGWGLQWSAERWSAYYKCARLNDGATGFHGNPRYQGAHRLDFAPLTNLRLGLTETVVVTTDGSFPFWLANPLLPWVLSQQEDRNTSEISNILWGLDVTWNIDPHWTLLGQFLLDDAMVDLEDRDTHPDQLGYLAGLAYNQREGRAWSAGLEYCRLGSWSYVHRYPDVRYFAWSGSLGHPQGPDSEAVTGFIHLPLPITSGPAMIWGRWHRKGRNHLASDESPVGSAGLPFPLPPVHTWWQFGSDASIPLGESFQLQIQMGYTQSPSDLAVEHLPPDLDYEYAQGWWLATRLTIPLFEIRKGIH